MAEPVRIEIDTSADGSELIDTLARRGLIGRLLQAGSGWEVELDSPREETQRLLRDLEPALATWLADRHRASIPLRVGERSLVVRRVCRSSIALPEGSPYVLALARAAEEKGGTYGSDRQMEPVA